MADGLFISCQTDVQKLCAPEKSATRFVTDEGDGIQLDEFVFGNKMYCLFKVGGVENFPVTSVQKVLLKLVR